MPAVDLSIPVTDIALAGVVPDELGGGAHVVAPPLIIAIGAPVPAVSTGAIVEPDAVDIALAAPVPRIAPVNIEVPVADIALAAHAPSITTPPTIGVEIEVPVADIALAAHAPEIAPHNVTVPAVDIALAAHAPSISPSGIAVPVANIALAAHAPLVTTPAAWEGLGLPCPQLSGFGYDIDLGLVRTPFDFGAPRQDTLYDIRPRRFDADFLLTKAQLATAEEWLDERGFETWELKLLSAESVTGAAIPHDVRITGNWSVSAVRADLYSLTLPLEVQEADESCSLVKYCDSYTACIGEIDWIGSGEWDDSIGLNWTEIEADWGDDSDWTRLNS